MSTISYDSLIWSEDELKKFYDNILKDCSPTETDFFCLAARKKYMSDLEKSKINLGDTCMMNKVILKEHNWDKFLSKVKQADANASFFTDRDGYNIPRNCIVYYVNINHTDVLKSIRDFKKLIADWDYDIASLIDFKNGNKVENIGKQLKTIQNNLLKSFQDPKNTNKKWIDIDCDVKNVNGADLKEKLMDFLKVKSLLPETLEPYVIQTHGGCHILVSTSSISEYNKYVAEHITEKYEISRYIMKVEKIIDFVKYYFKDYEVKEIGLNQNMMIPLPGILQAGFEVRIY